MHENILDEPISSTVGYQRTYQFVGNARDAGGILKDIYLLEAKKRRKEEWIQVGFWNFRGALT